MWETLLKSHQLVQKIEAHGVKYSKARDLFYLEHTSKNIFSTLINFNNILICIAFLIGFKWESNTGSSSNSYQLQILKTVIQSLNLSMFSIGIVATWTFNNHGDISCSIMNQARKFHRERNGKGGSNWNTLLFKLIIINIVSSCLGAMAAIIFTPFLCKITPPHLIYSMIFQSSSFSLEFTGFCCIYMATVGVFVCVKTTKLLLYMCAVQYETQFMLKSAYSYSNTVSGHSKNLPNFKSSIKIYQKCFLFICQFCKVGVAFFPFIMALGMCVNIVTSLICIKFHGSIPAILVVAFGGLDLATLVVTVGLYGFSVVGLEESDKFKKYWSRMRFMKKIERKQLAACLPITVNVAAFFTMQRKTLPQALHQIVNFTATLLMLDE